MIEIPETRGDQLLFFFDTRAARVSFINVSNPGDQAVVVEIAYYPQDLSDPAVIFRTLSAGSNEVLDPGLEAPGQAGLAVVTPVRSESDPEPIVPPRRLAGSFTLANQELSAAFGENAFARDAVDEEGEKAASGAAVDGEEIVYDQIRPQVLMVPTYFNPTNLAAPEQDGNRFILAAFDDEYGTPFRVTPPEAAVGLQATLCSRASAQVATSTLPVGGVVLTNLQELAGEGTTLDSSGSVYFAVPSGAGEGTNLLGVFAQSLATFASGHRLVAADAVPGCSVGGTPAPSAAPTPIPTPSPVPSCDGQRIDPGEQCDGTHKPSCEGFLSFVPCTGEIQCVGCMVQSSGCDCPCQRDEDCLSVADCIEGRCVQVR